MTYLDYFHCKIKTWILGEKQHTNYDQECKCVHMNEMLDSFIFERSFLHFYIFGNMATLFFSSFFFFIVHFSLFLFQLNL
jgi:hypothetical protein